jgi:thiol-disulfide isomerase/thioredoxin
MQSPQAMMGRRGIGILFVAAAILALGAGIAWRQFADDGARKAAADGTTLLALELPDIAGANQRLSKWKGKVLVVNFWATWCEPCREEIPRFVTLQDQLGQQGLQFVGIAIDPPEKAGAFAKEIGVNYPTLVAGYGAIELSKTLGNRAGALPFTVVVDRAGKIVFDQLGPVKDEQLRATLAKLL